MAMQKTIKFAVSLTLILVSTSLFACGGGGGGGGDGRTTDTGLRIIHAAIAISPLELVIPGVETDDGGPIQKAAYAETTSFVRAEKGETIIQLQRANSPGVFFESIPTTLEEKTEYSIFVYGDFEIGNDRVALLAEPVEQPESGFARVQLLNGLGGASRLEIAGSGATGVARFGNTSGFLEVPFGPQTFTITESGFPITTVPVDIPDRGEATIVVSGSQTLGSTFTRVYLDLD